MSWLFAAERLWRTMLVRASVRPSVGAFKFSSTVEHFPEERRTDGGWRTDLVLFIEASECHQRLCLFLLHRMSFQLYDIGRSEHKHNLSSQIRRPQL